MELPDRLLIDRLDFFFLLIALVVVVVFPGCCLILSICRFERQLDEMIRECCHQLLVCLMKEATVGKRRS